MDISGMKNSVAKRIIKGQEYYTFDLPLQGGTRKRLYGKSEAEVLKKAEEYEVPEIPEGLSVGRLYSYFLGLNGFGMKKNRVYREAKDFIPDEFLDAPASECSWDRVRDMLSVIDGDNKLKVQTSMTDFLLWGQGENRLPENPAMIEMTDAPKFSEKYAEDITEEQFLKLRKAVISDINDLILFVSKENSLKYRYAVLTAYVLYMGLRIQDALKVRGLEQRDDVFYLTGLNYEVPIPRILVSFTEKLLEVREGECLFGTLNRVTLAKTFDHYGTRMSAISLTPNSARRAFGKHLLNKGVNLYTLSIILNDDVETLAKAYREELTEDLISIINGE